MEDSLTLPITLGDFKAAMLTMKAACGEKNLIEKIALNGAELDITDKTVNITLPVASAEQTGVVKIGGGIDVAEDGTASVDLSTLTDDQVNVIAEKILPSEEEVDQMLDETLTPWTPEGSGT